MHIICTKLNSLQFENEYKFEMKYTFLFRSRPKYKFWTTNLANSYKYFVQKFVYVWYANHDAAFKPILSHWFAKEIKLELILNVNKQMYYGYM